MLFEAIYPTVLLVSIAFLLVNSETAADLGENGQAAVMSFAALVLAFTLIVEWILDFPSTAT